MPIRLYYAPGSCAFAALVALEEAGVDYEPAKLDLAAGEQRSSAYLAINPQGRVPALVVDDVVVAEVLAVLTYIGLRFPQAGILPIGDPLLLGKALELLSWFASTFHIHIAQIYRGERFADAPETIEALKEPGRRRYASAMAKLEAIARTRGEVLIGDRFGAVDAFALVLWRWAQRLNLDLAPLPTLAAKFERDMARPAVQRALAVERTGAR